MPVAIRETVLSRYRYDPLDRLSTQTDIQRFYCNNRLATEVGGGVQTSLFQHDDQLLAQRQVRADKIDTTLLATDQQRSVLNALDATRPHAIAYSPYGYRPPENGLLSLLGFNGERPDPVTGHYHLGNGYRQFNPVLMRFNSPDSWSPFGKGGLNAYVYCVGDPVNFSDPTGHMLKGKGPIVAPAAAKKIKHLEEQLGKLFQERLDLVNKEVEQMHQLAKTEKQISRIAASLPNEKTAGPDKSRLAELLKSKVDYSKAFTPAEKNAHSQHEQKQKLQHEQKQTIQKINEIKELAILNSAKIEKIEKDLRSLQQATPNTQLDKTRSDIRH